MLIRQSTVFKRWNYYVITEETCQVHYNLVHLLEFLSKKCLLQSKNECQGKYINLKSIPSYSRIQRAKLVLKMQLIQLGRIGFKNILEIYMIL